MYNQIMFRGAGLLFPYYLGLYHMLQRVGATRKMTKMRGMSSGAVVAVSLMCQLPCLHMLICFERWVQEWSYRRRWNQWQRLWCHLYLRWYFVGKFILHHVPNDVARSCSGRLTIVAFSVLDCRIVENNQWRDTRHLVEWVWASMALPLTSGPRYLDGQWLMDPYNFDLFWPFNRSFTLPNDCVMASPIEQNKHIVLRPVASPFSYTETLLFHRGCYHQYLYHLYRVGMSVALQHWLKFL